MRRQTVQVSVQIVEEPDAERLAAAARTMKLLADETRLRIIWNLLHGEHSVNALAAHLSMQPAAVSHHLAKLRSAGVVTTRRDGNRIFYSIADPCLPGVLDLALCLIEEAGR